MFGQLPDVVSDHVTDAAKVLGFKFIEQVFYEAAKGEQFPNAKDRAMSLHRIWMREGYSALPSFVKDFCLRACDGQHRFTANPSERL